MAKEERKAEKMKYFITNSEGKYFNSFATFPNLKLEWTKLRAQVILIIYRQKK